MPNIVVVGAGVSGLTTALLLCRDPANNVAVVARHMPGDYDIEYTSPWAGANVLPMATAKDSEYERKTWPELARLCADVPEAGIHFQPTVVYNREKDQHNTWGDKSGELSSTNPWWKDVMPDFKVLDAASVPTGYENGTSFTSVCINVPVYLSYLVGQCRKHGATFQRAVLPHIADAARLHPAGPADVVVNCTGLLASRLGGVMDANVVPARGQIVVVRNEPGVMVTVSGTDDGDDELLYIMQRAAGGGTILGGTYQIGKWESQPDPDTALRIMKRAVDVCPALTGGRGIEALSVIRHAVGLRPLRHGGVRIEREQIDGVWVVHNYGHGGWGYQASYGCAEKAARLVGEVLTKAKL